MSDIVPIPECITDKLRRLNQLVEQYPNSIPIKAISEFLGCDGQSVRAYLMMPNSFGMGWQKSGSLNRGFLVPTVKFYLWYRNMTGTIRDV